MKKSVYTILDEKAQVIGPLFVAVSDAEAERVVSSAAVEHTIMHRYPADFALLRLGDIDLASGALTPHAVPVLVSKVDVILHPAE